MANAQIINLNNEDKKYISKISRGEECYLIKDAGLTDQVEELSKKISRLENLCGNLETITRLLVERKKNNLTK